MWPDLRERSSADELMDDRSIGGQELAEALAQLRLINQVLGGGGPTIEGVVQLWRKAGRPRTLDLIDIGAGSGEVARRLCAWADQRGIDLHITLIDIHPDTCAVAAAFHQHEPRITVRQGDAFALEANGCDIVTASLFTHHFPADLLPPLVSAMARAARIGVVINDLQRHRFAWLAISLATRLLSRNRMIRHDAPLSVRRGFHRSELEALRNTPGLESLRCRWRPWFRYLVTVTRGEGQLTAGEG
jgi:2-polyprenyl-3-methyl-5-hydroxy-6-metoxy-1,4-benzoquinol methylase